jgi:hypothetical protein
MDGCRACRAARRVGDWKKVRLKSEIRSSLHWLREEYSLTDRASWDGSHWGIQFDQDEANATSQKLRRTLPSGERECGHCQPLASRLREAWRD